MEEEMHFNTTTPHVSPLRPGTGFPFFYVVILFVLLLLTGCVVVVYIRRRRRLVELRHRLIPRYSYDPTEEQENWGDTGRDEEGELAEPLYKEGNLSFFSGYGT